MKNRWPTTCEHCKAPIETGARITVYAGRTWRTSHLAEYQRQRRSLRGKR